MKSLLKRLMPETSPVRLLYHRLKALIAAIAYGFPARRLTVIGITGTDGKTTSVGMTAHILNVCGLKTGALSTAFFQVGTAVSWNPTQKTSPSPFLVQRFLKELVQAGCTHAVIECSSHGLLQGRVNHLFPTIAAITNVSEEHLDYHGTMERYRADKGMLFRMLKGHGVKVLNRKDATYELYRTIPSAWTIAYGRNEANYQGEALWLTDESMHTTSTEAVLHRRGTDETWALRLMIAGVFNRENALCAIGCAFAAGVDIDAAARALASFKGIPGRMERIASDTTLGAGHRVGQDFSVFVDFTVTPQSYQATLSAFASMIERGTGKRLLVLCGSCGDRMKEKRPLIGGIVASFADIAVVTNEDPYTEDPETIIDEVLRGVPRGVTIYRSLAHLPPHDQRSNKFFIRISDRLEAIRFLLSQAKSGDIVVLCGKGSDVTMMTKDGQVPWDEREIVRRELGASREIEN